MTTPEPKARSVAERLRVLAAQIAASNDPDDPHPVIDADHAEILSIAEAVEGVAGQLRRPHWPKESTVAERAIIALDNALKVADALAPEGR